MDKRPDILHYLKDHAVPPPGPVADEVWRRLSQEEDTQLREEMAKKEAGRFHHLQSHEQPPPDHLKASILTMAGRRARPKARVLYRVAAAVAAIVTGLAIVRYVGDRPDNAKKGAPIASGGVRSISNPAPADSSLAIPHSSAAQLASLPLPDPKALLSIFTPDGHRYPLQDNSVLATFMALRYSLLRTRLLNTDLNNGWQLRLDRYTNITLSVTMIDVLRKLYTTHSDGSATRNARKTLSRLRQWSEQDSIRFNTRNTGNPLDPVDLADFIFPPFLSFGSRAPKPLPATVPTIHADQPPHTHETNAPGNALRISYTLAVISGNNNTGISQTYNGGQQTLYDNGHQVRLRLATLMRIQSIFTSRNESSVTLVPESGKRPQTRTLTPAQWRAYNDRYADATCTLTDDATEVLGIPCRKAIIRLHNGRHITAWYAPTIQETAQDLLEPAFRRVPGLVLQYEYTIRRKTIRYTATELSRDPIDPSVFAVPAL